MALAYSVPASLAIGMPARYFRNALPDWGAPGGALQASQALQSLARVLQPYLQRAAFSPISSGAAAHMKPSV